MTVDLAFFYRFQTQDGLYTISVSAIVPHTLRICCRIWVLQQSQQHCEKS